jgi:glycosyltransferase involved in cell wall biosynthesis
MNKKISRTISVVILIYINESILSGLVERFVKCLEEFPRSFELLLINNGSKDISWDSILSVTEKDNRAFVINLRRNYNQHNALLCGIRQAKNDAIITIDDDFQYPPEEIHKLFEKLEASFDVIYGILTTHIHSRWRNFYKYFSRGFNQSMRIYA